MLGMCHVRVTFVLSKCHVCVGFVLSIVSRLCQVSVKFFDYKRAKLHSIDINTFKQSKSASNQFKAIIRYNTSISN